MDRKINLKFLHKSQIIVYTKNKNGRNVKMKTIDTIALVLVIIGAINWGLIGLFKFNLVDTIFGTMSALSRIIYTLVGISGLWSIKLIFDRK